ncbi:hypothetical protein BDY19DRAFT_967666 [Irpex rosettiformis]|uniref:Uncharacterized protein n=1 Tax=Irpex rosettiformis TaxID=378272 RepID=A0ACB8TSL2_9APHY|nr:hypothetical protein BDY19DRAFT_967666 [Irpex rosettiformis]
MLCLSQLIRSVSDVVGRRESATLFVLKRGFTTSTTTTTTTTMGTRGILGYIIRGRYRGTYVHSDSYPEGLGADIAEFLSMLTEEDRVRLIERLNEVKTTCIHVARR